MKNTTLDQVIELSKRIALLREELAEKEQELSSVISPRAVQVSTVQHSHSGRTLHGSIAERVRSFVAANPGRAIPISEIIQAHRAEDAATIRSTVHRLANGGMDGFSCVAHGAYRFDQEKPFADVRVGVQHDREARS